MLDVTRGQIERGHAVGILCDSTTGGDRGRDALEALRPDLSLGLYRIPMRRAPHPLDINAIVSLTNVYRRKQPEVLHGHGSKGGAYARLVAVPGLDRRAIRAYTPHGGSFNQNPGSFSHGLYMQAEAMLARRTDLFLFESEYVKGRFEAYVGGPTKLVRVVVNGIAPAEFELIVRDPQPFDLVYIGELRPAKGVETLIDALALLRQDYGRRLTLLMVGSGPSEPELHQRAKLAGIWDDVSFVPPGPIRPALARGRIMVIPSKAESLPYVILEAAAAAQPLISTDVGGIAEIFGPYSTELIKPNDPAILAERILGVIDESDSVRDARARAIRRYVEGRFQIDRMVDGVLAGYRDALAAKGALPAPRRVHSPYSLSVPKA